MPEPIDVVAALRARGPVAFLDGALDADGLGNWSVVGSAPRGAIFAWGERILHIDAQGRRRWERGDPLAALEASVESLALAGARSAPSEDGPPAGGLALGYLGYELGAPIEGIGLAPGRSLLPDLAFGLFAEPLRYDRQSDAWHGTAGLRELSRLTPPPAPVPAARRVCPLRADFTREAYEAAVTRIRELILEGEVYQVNLAQCFHGELLEDPLTIYRRLRERRPAPLGAFLELGTRAVLSNSPELFLARRGSHVETRPIKGTRRRGASPEEDAALAAELDTSPKDEAELTMIVDLMRNDFGKLAVAGSVAPVCLGRRVKLPTVHHRVARIDAELRPRVGTAELLRAVFPAGSVTGCPKRRAMQVIASIEPCPRGVYTGAIGWIAPGGDLGLSVAIRTLSCARGRFRVHAGGGVVLDSDPASEYEETLVKAQALLEALGAELEPARELHKGP